MATRERRNINTEHRFSAREVKVRCERAAIDDQVCAQVVQLRSSEGDACRHGRGRQGLVGARGLKGHAGDRFVERILGRRIDPGAGHEAGQ